jgi:hypothetical protein
VPPNWNGVPLLHSREYAAEAGSPEDAPARYRELLLSAGYDIDVAAARGSLSLA